MKTLIKHFPSNENCRIMDRKNRQLEASIDDVKQVLTEVGATALCNIIHQLSLLMSTKVFRREKASPTKKKKQQHNLLP